MKLIFRVPVDTRMQLKLGKLSDDATLTYQGRKVNTLPTSAIKLANKETMENQTLQVLVKGLDLVSETNQIVYSFTSMVFAKNTLAKIEQAGDNAELRFQDLLLGTIQIKGNLDGLFERRPSFDAQLVATDGINIVRYAWIHQHSEYSLLDGIIGINDLVKKVEYGSALTDHGNMYGALEFYKAMTKAGKKPMIGCEVYIETIQIGRASCRERV